MVGTGEGRSKKPTLRPIVGVAIVLIAGFVAAAIAYRQPIAEALLMRQLRNLGLDRVEFAIRRFDAVGRTTARDTRRGGSLIRLPRSAVRSEHNERGPERSRGAPRSGYHD